jgi:DNA-binding transcriptional LysR family regulator
VLQRIIYAHLTRYQLSQVSLNQRHLTRSVATQLAMVGAGAGVAIAPASAVPDGPTAKAVRQQHLPAKVTASTELSAIHRDEPDLLIERFLALNQA